MQDTTQIFELLAIKDGQLVELNICGTKEEVISSLRWEYLDDSVLVIAARDIVTDGMYSTSYDVIQGDECELDADSPRLTWEAYVGQRQDNYPNA